MKNKIISLILVTFLLFFSSCNKDDSGNNSGLTNKIEFGTGVHPNDNQQLIGKNYTFNKPAIIFFRVESIETLQSAVITVKIDKSSGTNYITYANIDYPTLQSSKNIYISSFSINEEGNFKASAFIKIGNRFIASAEFKVN